MEDAPNGGGKGATQRVYDGILADLERRRMVPGQRLIETELAQRFGVGRNAVREAMQRLAVRGVVDLTRHSSATIRKLDAEETMEVLEVAAAMTSLVAGIAARNFQPLRHSEMLSAALREISRSDPQRDSALFSRARRGFYRTLLAIGGNRELMRLFPAIGMHIIYSQFQSPRLHDIRAADYRAICDAVSAGDVAAAQEAGLRHVEQVRSVISDLLFDDVRFDRMYLVEPR